MNAALWVTSPWRLRHPTLLMAGVQNGCGRVKSHQRNQKRKSIAVATCVGGDAATGCGKRCSVTSNSTDVMNQSSLPRTVGASGVRLSGVCATRVNRPDSGMPKLAWNGAHELLRAQGHHGGLSSGPTHLQPKTVVKKTCKRHTVFEAARESAHRASSSS